MRKIVKGEGPKNAKIIFIGEAPGKNEEIQGRPFVGRAGKFLRKNIEAIGLNEKKVYITNIVKIRPRTGDGGNRKPAPAEIKKFLPLLKKELSAMRPKVIILLGDTALKTMLGPDYFIGKHHGKTVVKNNKKYFITYHPSAASQYRTAKIRFTGDMKKLRKLIRS